MLIEDAKRKQEQLRNILRELARENKDENELKRYIQILKSLYSDHFRHRYADIFPIVVEWSNDTQYSTEFFNSNFDGIYKLAEKRYIENEAEYTNLYESLTKLRDHINLEIGRYNYYHERELEQAKDSSQSVDQKTLLSKVNNAIQGLNKAERKMDSVQKELIAVLGIFAAIVFTFAGGIGVLGNALSSVSSVPACKTVFFILVCGFVLINTVFMLLYVVSRIIERSIMSPCESDNCNCSCKNKKGKPKCWFLRRIRKRLPYVFWMNVLLLALMAADAVVWKLL